MTARAPVTDAISASPDQVTAFRLSRHHLVKRAPASALAQVAGDMAGAPAPVLSAAPISLWARTPRPFLGDCENPPLRGPAILITRGPPRRPSLHPCPQ